MFDLAPCSVTQCDRLQREVIPQKADRRARNYVKNLSCRPELSRKDEE